MSEAIEAAPGEPVVPVAVQSGPEEEAAAPENFGIFEEGPPAEASPAEHPGETPAPVEEPAKSKAFLNKIQQDRQKRAHEIELKKREIALRQQGSELQSLKQQQELLQQNPSEFLRKQGIDPLTFQRQLAEGALSDAIENNDSNAIKQTQMEVAKLKSELAQRDRTEQQRQAQTQQQTAINQFVSSIGVFQGKSPEKYPRVTETLTPQDIAQGMGEHWRNTGEELTIEQAFDKLELTLQKHEDEFYNNPKVIEKFQRYHAGLAQKKQVNGPQATMTSRWKEQPTRKEPDEMSLDEIRKAYPLFT